MAQIDVKIVWNPILMKKSEDWRMNFCVYMYFFKDEPYLIGETATHKQTVRKRYIAHQSDGTNEWIRNDIKEKYGINREFYKRVGIPFYRDSDRRITHPQLIKEIEWILFSKESDELGHCRANIRNTESYTAVRSAHISILNVSRFHPLSGDAGFYEFAFTEGLTYERG